MSVFCCAAVLARANTKVNNYTFKGNSDHWSAEYITKQIITETTKNDRLSYDTEFNSKFILTYKGDISELRNAKKLVYTDERSTGKGKSEIEFTSPPEEKVFTSQQSGKGCSLLSSDEVIKVTVDLDGKKESFNLK